MKIMHKIYTKISDIKYPHEGNVRQTPHDGKAQSCASDGITPTREMFASTPTVEKLRNILLDPHEKIVEGDSIKTERKE